MSEKASRKGFHWKGSIGWIAAGLVGYAAISFFDVASTTVLAFMLLGLYAYTGVKAEEMQEEIDHLRWRLEDAERQINDLILRD